MKYSSSLALSRGAERRPATSKLSSGKLQGRGGVCRGRSKGNAAHLIKVTCTPMYRLRAAPTSGLGDWLSGIGHWSQSLKSPPMTGQPALDLWCKGCNLGVVVPGCLGHPAGCRRELGCACLPGQGLQSTSLCMRPGEEPTHTSSSGEPAPSLDQAASKFFRCVNCWVNFLTGEEKQ